MDKKFLIKTLTELVNIPSYNPPGNEKNIAIKISEILKNFGIFSEINVLDEERANVIGIIDYSSNGPVIVLNGHLDTVPLNGDWKYNPFKGEINRNRFYGLGTSDMKGALVSMLCAAKNIVMAKKEFKGKLILSFVADEERNNLGTLDFLKRFKNIDYVVIGEPTNLDVVTSNRGCIRLKIKTYGIAGHCSNPNKGINAIYKMNKIINKLLTYAKYLNNLYNNRSLKPSLSINVIKGGTAENIIPDACEIIIDRRIIHTENKDIVEKELIKQIKDIKKYDKEFKFSYKRIEEIDPWKVSDNSNLLKICKEVYSKVFSKKPKLKDLGGSCEAALFKKMGLDTIVFGPGNIKQAHAKDEYIDIDKMLHASNFYYYLIKNILVKN